MAGFLKLAKSDPIAPPLGLAAGCKDDCLIGRILFSCRGFIMSLISGWAVAVLLVSSLPEPSLALIVSISLSGSARLDPLASTEGACSRLLEISIAIQRDVWITLISLDSLSMHSRDTNCRVQWAWLDSLGVCASPQNHASSSMTHKWLLRLSGNHQSPVLQRLAVSSLCEAVGLSVQAGYLWLLVWTQLHLKLGSQHSDFCWKAMVQHHARLPLMLPLKLLAALPP